MRTNSERYMKSFVLCQQNRTYFSNSFENFDQAILPPLLCGHDI